MPNENCDTRKNGPSSQDHISNPTTAGRRELGYDVAGRFLGTWRLVAFSRNGQPHPAYGRTPTGTIRYEADGNMAVQIMPDPRRPSEPAPAEATAIPGYIAYFGAYRIDPLTRTVSHDRVGNVTAGEPRSVARQYEFLPGGRLALTLAEDSAAQVLWERVH